MFKGGRLKFKGDRSKQYSSIPCSCLLTMLRISAGVSKSSSEHFQVSKENAQLKALKEELSQIPEEGWVEALELEDLKGPVMILLESHNEKNRDSDKAHKFYYMLAAEEERAAVGVQETQYPVEPLSVSNVFIGQTLIPNVFCFKSAFGKYLSVDGVGRICAGKEAVSASEEWTVIRKDDGWALQSSDFKFMSVGADRRVRGDADSIGFAETFTILCQAAKKKERISRTYEKEMALLRSGSTNDDVAAFAVDEERKYQSFGWGKQRKLPASASLKKDLEDAAQSGNLHEALLQQRIKSKHDPFC